MHMGVEATPGSMIMKARLIVSLAYHPGNRTDCASYDGFCQTTGVRKESFECD